jgi:hypothetical protein
MQAVISGQGVMAASKKLLIYQRPYLIGEKNGHPVLVHLGMMPAEHAATSCDQAC